MRFLKFAKYLPVVSILIFLLLAWNSELCAQENCGECPDPIVKLDNLELGDVSSVRDELLEMAEEYTGWEELLEEKKDVSAFEILNRAWGYLFDLKKKNTCADIFYEYDVYVGEGEWETRRTGVKEGKAKYIIQSIIDMKKPEDNDYALIRRVVYNKPSRKVSEWGVVYYEYDGDVIELSNELDLIQKKGDINLSNKLICLKNNAVYDTGDIQIDWIPDPPRDEGYYDADGESKTIDGKVYKGSEGIFLGSFAVGHLSGIPIRFSRGDIGVTIRKKETPTSCSIDIDDSSDYPPHYKISVTSIANQFNETMPDNVMVALKVHKGKIRNGKDLDGWQVFNTRNGKIVEPVLYKPPPCSEAKSDILEIAGVCDFHDGPPSIGKTRIKREIPNSQCYDAVARLTGVEIVIETGETTHKGAGGSETRNRNYHREIEGKVSLMLEKTQTLPMMMYNEYYEYYDIKAIHLTSFRAALKDREYRHSTDKNGWREVTETWDGHDFNANVKLPAHYSQIGLGQVVVVFDTKTKRAKAVNNLAGWVNYVFQKEFLQEGEGTSKATGPYQWTHTDSSEDDEVFSIEPVGEKKLDIPRISLLTSPEYLVISGDGVNIMAGSGHMTIDDCSHHKRDYTTCKTEKTFEWEFQR